MPAVDRAGGRALGRRPVTDGPRVVREVRHLHHQRVALPAAPRVAHAEPDGRRQMRAPVERDVARVVVPLVEDDDGAGNLQDLVGVVADRQVRARQGRGQALDARIEERQLFLPLHDLVALLGGPCLQRHAAVGRVDDHRRPHALARPGRRIALGAEEAGERVVVARVLGIAPRLEPRRLQGLRRPRQIVPAQVGVAPRRARRLVVVLLRGERGRRDEGGAQRQRRDREERLCAHGRPPGERHVHRRRI